MANGGRREGAGRKKNSPNKATKERQERIAASGATPLDVMIETMRWHHDRAKAEMSKDGDRDEALIATELAAAHEAAKGAAPYVHPRLAAVEHMGKGGGPIEYSDAKQRLSHLIAGQTAAAEADGDTGEPVRH